MNAHQRLLSIAAREGTIMTVVLKPQDAKYKVHEALLIEASDYFKKALTGPWKEAEEDVIRLTDVETAVFDMFVAWLYARTLPCDTLSSEALCREWALQMVQAYAFGDRFQATEFKSDVLQLQIDHYLFQGLGHPTYFAVIIYAFSNLPESDPLLRLFVDVQAKHYDVAEDEGVELEDRKELPHEFLLRVMMRYSVVTYPSATELCADDYKLTEWGNED